MSDKRAGVRVYWLDIIKGLGILSIIAVHTGYLLQFNIVFPLLSAWMLAIFPLAGGWLYRYKPGFIQFFYKKFIHLIVPYFIFAGLSFMGWLFLKQSYAKDVLSVPLQGIWSDFYHGYGFVFNGPLWFLPAYFLSLVLVQCVFGWWDKRNAVIKLISILVVIIVSLFLIQLGKGRFFSYDIALLFVSYILLAKLVSAKIGDKIFLSFSNSIIIAVIFLAGVCLNGWVDVYYHNINIPWLYYLNSLTGSLLIVQIAQKILLKITVLREWLVYIGRHSLIIFATHWHLMEWITYILYVLGFINNKNSNPTFVNFHLLQPTHGLLLTVMHILIFTSYTLLPILFVVLMLKIYSRLVDINLRSVLVHIHPVHI